ncbi:C40 family peptidase [Methylophaga sp. OBS4]|uniref:C40 family peptidase n=1 Tax=Methylophaga sp. OBS4 TaxID=2991935 RepID=UPI002259EE9A|nr:C40 family peptidase [Methylophaga sp. OBS4]MCX4187456.1 C40 family peptidase [Methylophaga sp. OBS4]
MSCSKLFWLFCLCALTACSTTPTQPIKTAARTDSVTSQVLDNAYSWLGTPYQYGGTTKAGIDCSGLVHEVYSQVKIALPRTAQQQSRLGNTITKNKAMSGDLIFFRTSDRKIYHVGIINKVQGNKLSFIHSSESKGVIISSSDNVYWKPRIVKVVRVINQ